MTFGKLIVFALLAALSLTAQEGISRKVVTLKYLHPQQVQNLFRDFGVRMAFDPNTKAVVLAGESGAVDALEQAIRKIDIAQAQLEIAAHLIVSSPNAEVTPAEMPADLAPVVKQLRTTFTNKVYRLLETLYIRTSEKERAQTSGKLPNGWYYEFGFQRAQVLPGEGATGHMIRIENLELNMKHEIGAPSSVRIATNTEIREGQKVVIGKGAGANNESYFLVLTAKVVQ